MMESAHGRGWLLDEEDSRDWQARALFGAPLHLPNEASLEEHVARVENQKKTSSCVGQAIARALHVRLRKLGFSPEPFSAQAIYKAARRRSIPTIEPLSDDGCRPRDAMMAIQEQGVPLESEAPFNPETINENLFWDELQSASKFVVFRWWRIVGDGRGRADAIAQALAKGYPVVFGMTLWAAFDDYESGTITHEQPDDAGGHMMLIVGFRTRSSDGKREFRVLNSWGTGWGEGGFCWIHEDVIGGSRVGDVYAIQVQ